MDYRNIVLSSYPKAVCQTIKYPQGEYFMIHDMESILPMLLGYDMTSEENAWEFAATRIGNEMMRILEK